MGLFRRRQGRHALGAPVAFVPGPAVAAAPEPWLTASLPYAAVLPVAPVVADDGSLLSGIAALIASGEAWDDAARPVRVSAETSPSEVVSTRVQLGFRDGTTAALDPGCEQAAALEELALLLNLRDDVAG